MLQVLQQFMTEEQVVRVAGQSGQQMWFTFGYEDIAGEYDFEVEAGSTQPNNEAFRQQQAMSLMNAVAPLVGVVIDPVMLARHVLQNGFGVKNVDDFLMEQQMGGGMPPDAGAGPPGELPPVEPVGAQAGMGGVPPEILSQLQGQVGLNL